VNALEASSFSLAAVPLLLLEISKQAGLDIKTTESTETLTLLRRLEPSEGDAQDLIHFVKTINGEVEVDSPVRCERGRKVKTETKLLMKFVSPKGKVPKKEYLRIHILRGLRKMVQKCSEYESNFNGINQIPSHDADVKASTTQAWEAFMDYYTSHISEIHLHFNEVDFKTRKGNFNNEYCRRVH
jgi:hypothetical protein